MHTEVEYAVNFLVDTIKEKHISSEDIYEKLKERLTTLLHKRYEGHWYADKPMKGSAYRCINISTEDSSVDQVLRQAAEENGVDSKTLLKIFDKGLALWVDPNDVSCRLGKGSIFFIYKKLKENVEPKATPTISATSTTPSISQHTHRPQQRPRSISPTTTSIYIENYVPQSSRPRSTTPPGFSRMDAGSFTQSFQRSALSSENLQKLWNTIPNTTTYTDTSMSSYSQATYVPSSTYNTYNNYTYSNNFSKPVDSSYSFNQYSSYYNPSSNGWKKNNRYQSKPHHQSKVNWQDDEVYQRYHWSRNDLKSSMSVAGNNIAMKSYGYSSPRQAQEVY